MSLLCSQNQPLTSQDNYCQPHVGISNVSTTPNSIYESQVMMNQNQRYLQIKIVADNLPMDNSDAGQHQPANQVTSTQANIENMIVNNNSTGQVNASNLIADKNNNDNNNNNYKPTELKISVDKLSSPQLGQLNIPMNSVQKTCPKLDKKTEHGYQLNSISRLSPELQNNVYIKTQHGYQLLKISVPEAGTQSVSQTAQAGSSETKTTASTTPTSVAYSVALPVSAATADPAVPSLTKTRVLPINLSETTPQISATLKSDQQKVMMNKMVKKCCNFFNNLLAEASTIQKSNFRNFKSYLTRLIQDVIDNKIETKQFVDRLELMLNAVRQPLLVDFLTKSLPHLRASLYLKQMTIDGIRPPPPRVALSALRLEPTSAKQQSLIKPKVKTPVSVTPTRRLPPLRSKRSSVTRTILPARVIIPSGFVMMPPASVATLPTTLTMSPATVAMPSATAATPPTTLAMPLTTGAMPLTTGATSSGRVMMYPPTIATPPRTLTMSPTTLAMPLTTGAMPLTTGATSSGRVMMYPPTIATPPKTLTMSPTTLAMPLTAGAMSSGRIKMSPATVAMPSATVATPSATVAIPPTTLSMPPATVTMSSASFMISPTTVTMAPATTQAKTYQFSSKRIQSTKKLFHTDNDLKSTPVVGKKINKTIGRQSLLTTISNIQQSPTISSPMIQQSSTLTLANVNKVLEDNKKINIAIGAREKKPVSSIETNEEELNDVMTMGGIDIAEESKTILSSTDKVGTEVRSCKEKLFLNATSLQNKIKQMLLKHGLEGAESDVITLVSQATEQRLRGIIEKMSTISEHRLDFNRNDPRYEMTQDVRAQLRFLQEVDKAECEKREAEELALILKASKSKSKNDEQMKLKEKAKDMQKAEMEKKRQRDADLTALQALCPRKKKPRLDVGMTSSTASGLSRQPFRPRIKKICMKDLLFVLQEEQSSCRSTLLYKSYLKY